MDSSTRSSTTRDNSSGQSVLVTCLFKCGLLLGRGFLLILRFPLLERHAVDRFAALILAHWHALGVRCFLHPVGEAIAAEAGEIHHVDILHVGTRAQMVEQTPEGGGFEFGAGLVVHGQSSRMFHCEDRHCAPRFEGPAGTSGNAVTRPWRRRISPPGPT